MAHNSGHYVTPSGFSLHARIMGEGSTNHSPPALFISGWSAHAQEFHSSRQRISLEWLSNPRWLWISVSWWVACKFISLVLSPTKLVHLWVWISILNVPFCAASFGTGSLITTAKDNITIHFCAMQSGDIDKGGSNMFMNMPVFEFLSTLNWCTMGEQ